MRQYDWVEGHNLVLEERFGGGQLARLPALADDLVGLRVQVILAFGANAGLAARKATTTTPVVFIGVADPVAYGLVDSLARPGGNVTGLSLYTLGLQTSKFLELLKSTVPGLTRVAVLANPDSLGASVVTAKIQEQAGQFGIQTLILEVRSQTDLDAAFVSLTAWGAQALYVISDSGGVVVSNYNVIADRALRARLPSITAGQPFVAAGGLMTFVPNNRRLFERAAYFVDRILRGANPGDLPVEQPTAFEFAVNVRTARALGISFPPDVAAQVTDWVQ
jgi:putative tryptophan/tyrosine transport system substrate-binding protein